MKLISRPRRMFSVFYVLLLAAGVAGCSTISGSYQSTKVAPRALYCEPVRRSFDYEGPDRNPIVFIHGLLGAQLRDFGNNGNVVWGRFSPLDMLTAGSFKTLALPLEPQVRRGSAGSVAPSGLLDRSVIELFWFRFYLENYEPLVTLLRDSGYVPEGDVLPEGKHFYSLFIFYYDWRLNIADNAARLAEFIDIRRAYLRKRYEELYHLRNHDVRFDLIGHSMGGLVARYYIQYGAAPLGSGNDPLPTPNWAGAKNVEKVIVAGTPNGGYADTFIELLDGLQLLPLAPVYPAGVIGTFPSYYQMLPDPGFKAVRYADSQQPVDVFDVSLWKKYRWGILSESPANQQLLAELLPQLTPTARQRAVLAQLEYCLDAGRRFKLAMAREMGAPPPPTRFYLFAGDGMLTNHTLEVHPVTGVVSVAKQEPGDGKITSTSARFDRRDGGHWSFHMNSPIHWQAVHYLPGAHMGIMSSDSFMDNLRFILMVEP